MRIYIYLSFTSIINFIFNYRKEIIYQKRVSSNILDSITKINSNDKKYLNKYRILEEKIEKKKLSDDIIILFTNDVHCGIMENIGYDGLSLYKKELKEKYKTVLTVDTGDAIQGGAIGILSRGMDIVNIMNKIHYDVTILGNHEFDYGISQIKYISEKLNNSYICSNCCFRKNKTSIFPPYKIIKINSNTSIGFIGVDTPQTFSKTFLHSCIDKDGKPVYDFLTHNNGKELYDTLQKYINEVQTKGANYVILLSHLGNNGDSLKRYTTDTLVSNLEGVDLVLDGHSHLSYNILSKDKKGKLIPIIQGGSKFSHIGKITIKNNGKILSELISEIPEPINKTKALYIKRKKKMRWVDSEMKKILEDIIFQYSENLNRIIGFSNFDMLINNSRGDECPLCNLIADGIREVGNADCSIINAGNVRNNLMQGDITYNDILDVLPFADKIVIKEIKGIDLLDALEFGVRSLPNRSQRFPHVSGIVFDVNTKIESTIEVDDNEMFVGVKGQRRVSDVMINGKKLSLNKKYKIALSDFVSSGGDGYSMFSKYKVAFNTFIEDNEAFITFIQNKFNGTIPDFYRVKQGRIVIDSNEEFDIFYHSLYKIYE
jgi:2',3'-cyclic-nucleotide 2'-phosphodiesterase (5'-nucleotidase family)